MIELFLCWPVHEENPVKLFKVAFDCNISEGWVLSTVNNINDIIIIILLCFIIVDESALILLE